MKRTAMLLIEEILRRGPQKEMCKTGIPTCPAYLTGWLPKAHQANVHENVWKLVRTTYHFDIYIIH